MANFSEQQIQDAWEKGKKVGSNNHDLFRQDIAGAWIQRNKYGLQELFGWEVDHIFPSSKGGTNDLINLRPMHWENNRSKADNYPIYKTVKTSACSTNIDKENEYIVIKELQLALKRMYNI